jgi:hypothetical protein
MEFKRSLQTSELLTLIVSGLFLAKIIISANYIEQRLGEKVHTAEPIREILVVNN